MNDKINIVSIDLGTKNLIIRINEETIFDQSSSIVFDTENGQVFIGNEALLMKNKIPPTKIYCEPLANGVISNADALIALLSEIFVNIAQVQNKKMWNKKNFWSNSVILIGIPSKIYRIDEEVLVQSLQGLHIPKIPGYSEKFNRYKYFSDALKADKIRIIPEVKLAAIGAGAPIWSPQGVFILDIGGGTSDCAVISAGDIIVQDSITLAGNKIDDYLKKFIEENYFLTITREEAELAKIQCGVYVENFENLKEEEKPSIKDQDDKVTVYGKSSKTGSHEKIEIEKRIIAKIVAESLEPIIDLCKRVILQSGPSFSRTIEETGLIVSGGSAKLENLDKFLCQKLNLKYVSIATTPEKCVIKGTEIYEMHKYDLYNKGYIRPSR